LTVKPNSPGLRAFPSDLLAKIAFFAHLVRFGDPISKIMRLKSHAAVK